MYPAANATMEGSVQLKMLQILQEIQAAQNAGHNNSERDNEGGGNRNNTRDNNRNRSRNRNRKTPDNTAFQRADKSEYCWTHRACNHKSGACNRKAPEHRKMRRLLTGWVDQMILCAIKRNERRMAGGDRTSATI